MNPMGILLFFVMGCTSLIAATSGQSDTGEAVHSLDGKWEFTVDPTTATGGAEASWDTIQVPGNWDTLPKYASHVGFGWYRRTFDVPDSWKGKHIRLRFEAVYHDAEVSLNGKPLGNHSGGYTPFEFDVTQLVTPGTPSTLTVRADNRPARGAWWHWGGISRSVNLIANQETRIVHQHIHAEPDLKDGSAQVTVSYEIENSSARGMEIKIQPQLRPPLEPGGKRYGNEIACAALTLQLPPRQITSGQASFKISQARLWHFDQPNLYELTSSLSFAGALQHRRSDRFGIRQVRITPDGLSLNGERIRVAGFNRVSDSNQTGNTEPDALVKQDVALMKRAGCVFTRIMHYPQAPNLLDELDAQGMLVICEIPVWGADDPNIKEGNPVTKLWLQEMIRRDFNHPCIIGWSPGNEMGKHYDYVRSMNGFIRQLDPHRLVTYASHTAHRKEASPKNDPVGFCDLTCSNIYVDKAKPTRYGEVARLLRSRWPDKPVFFTEFGVGQIGASTGSTIPGIDQILRSMAEEPWVIGGSLWTFNDYRSGYKDTPPSGNREWGVVDVNRKPKAAYEQIRKLFSPVHSLAVEGTEIVITPRTPAEIPSYTLRGYRLRYQQHDTTGKSLPPVEIPLPDLPPGAPAWRTTIPKTTAGGQRTAELVSPTGHTMAETMIHGNN